MPLPLLNLLKKVLQKVSLELGELIGYGALLTTIGFGFGWAFGVMVGARWCLPAF